MNGLPAVRRRLTGLAVRASEATLAAVGVAPPAALLLLAHMRSGSTLLLHILLTDPEISGMGERNAPYASPEDLSRLVVRTRYATRRPLARWRYVADQINHNNLTPGPALLAHPRVRVLFLLREPEQTVASLLALTREHYRAWSVAEAVAYYQARLDHLAGCARSLPVDRARFLSYADLTQRSGETLGRLQEFLGTRAGFSERYALHDFTGRRGDPSPMIRTGAIGRPPGSPSHTAPAAAPAPDDAREMKRAHEAYARCRAAMAPLALLRDTG